MVDAKPVVFFVLGGPGSGKGTQCAKMVEQYGFAHLSAGDLLREERDSGSETAQLINQVILNGCIVPSHITCQLLKKGMEKKGWAEKRFLIDGFPRNQDNYDSINIQETINIQLKSHKVHSYLLVLIFLWLFSYINQQNYICDCWSRVMNDLVEVPFVLFMDADEETMINRIMERSKTSGRNDDNIARFDTFRNETMPIVDLFASKGKIIRINSLRGIDEVFEDVKHAFEAYLQKYGELSKILESQHDLNALQ